MPAIKTGPDRQIPRLEVAVAGTGRDGAMSLAQIIHRRPVMAIHTTIEACPPGHAGRSRVTRES